MRMKWIFVYQFVMIVRDIKIRLQAEDFSHLNIRLKWQKKFNTIMLSFYAFCQISIVSINIIDFLDIIRADKGSIIKRGMQYTKIGLNFVVIIIDITIGIVLLELIRFYLKKKWQKE